MRKNIITNWALLALQLPLASTALADNVANGAQIAQVWCANCHVVPGSSGPALQGPPSFRAIAKSDKTPDQLRAFLTWPHGSMPQLSLSRLEIDDLLAYVSSLR